MRLLPFIIIAILILEIIYAPASNHFTHIQKASGQVEQYPTLDDYKKQLPLLKPWTRPLPPKVGLQVGHWKIRKLPDELANLRNQDGASGAGKMEWQVNYTIATQIETLLKERNISVDLLPATIPPGYSANAFLAIH